MDDVLAAHRQALGAADQIRTLASTSTMFMGGERVSGVKSWWRGRYWMREYRRNPLGQRIDFFGPEGALVFSGRTRARFRPDDRRTRPFYYVAKAISDPFPLLPYTRDPQARAGLQIGSANGYDVLALPADEYGVRTLYLLEEKTARLAGVRFEIEANTPFATIQFENHGEVAVGEARAILPFGIHVEMHLAKEIDTKREIAVNRISLRERIDSWTPNPADMPKRLAPAPLPTAVPAGFTRTLVPTGPEPRDVAVGDLDRDGRADIAVACTGGLTVHFGGAEDKPVRIPLGKGTHHGCQIVDFDLDGRLDVMTMSWVDPSDTMFLVEFDDKRVPQTRKLFAAPNFGWGLAVDDFDRDGLPDYVATGWGSRDVTWKFGNGSGGIRFTGTGWPLVENGINPERGFGVGVGDLNGDGLRDVAVTEPDRPRVVLFQGQPNLAFRPFAALTEKNVGLVRPVDVQLSDLDGDGLDEVIVAQDHPRQEIEGDIGVFLNTGSTFKALYLAAGDRVQCVRVGDLDGDGHPDLVAASNGTDQIAWLRGLGEGKFAEAQFMSAGRGPTCLAIADLDGDQRLDVVSSNILDDTLCIVRNEVGKTVTRPAPPKTAVIPVHVPGEFRLKGLSAEYEFMGEWRLPLSIPDPSGITFLHGDGAHSGLVIASDKKNAIHRVTIDRGTRRLLVGPAIEIRGLPEGRLDFEGLAFDRPSGTLFIGCEEDSGILRTTLFGRLLGRTQSEIEVDDNDGIEAVALRRLKDGTPLLYVFKERNGTTGRQPVAHCYDILESPLKLIRRGEPLRVPVALVDQTGAVASGQKLFLVSRFARSIAEIDFEGDGFAEKFKVASFAELAGKLLGYPKLPAFGMVEGIARAPEETGGDLFLLVDNNRTEIGIAGKNRGTEGRMLWFRNVSPIENVKQPSRVFLRALTVPFKGAKDAPEEALDREQAKQLAAKIRERLLAGDDPVAVARELKLPRGPVPFGFSLIRPPAVRNATDVTETNVPIAFARLAFNLRVGEAEICGYDKVASPYGFTVVLRVK